MGSGFLGSAYADGEEDGARDLLGSLGREGREQHGADEGADNTGRCELAQHAVVRVAAVCNGGVRSV